MTAIRTLYIVPLASTTPDALVFGRVRLEPGPGEVVALVADGSVHRTLGEVPSDRVVAPGTFAAADLGAFRPLLDRAPKVLAAAYDEAGHAAHPLSRRLRAGQSGGLLRAQGGLELYLSADGVRTQYDPEPVPLVDLLRELGLADELDPETSLDAWLLDRQARHLWSCRPLRNDDTLHAYRVNGRALLVHRYAGGGWELYTANDSIKILETLADADARLKIGNGASPKGA